ncbi:MAG: hypothetical protein J5758_06760 [Abditibacteriota bacterium]|nr:hypothetical protein [Abditibacteriota bacterium]
MDGNALKKELDKLPDKHLQFDDIDFSYRDFATAFYLKYYDPEHPFKWREELDKWWTELDSSIKESFRI